MRGAVTMLLFFLALPLVAQAGISDDDFYNTILSYNVDKPIDIVQITHRYFSGKTEIDPHDEKTLFAYYSALFEKEKYRDAIMLDSRKYSPSVRDLFRKIERFDLESFYKSERPSPKTNDMYWASFYANGHLKYLFFLVDVAMEYAHERGDIMLYMSASSAMWSLAERSKDCPAITEFLETLYFVNHHPVVYYILHTDPEKIRSDTVEYIQIFKKGSI